MNITIIPALGGSKRIPRKNIKAFAGKPMIAHAIEAAQASGLFEHVLVSTDVAEIQTIATACGQRHRFSGPFNWHTTSNVSRGDSLITSARSASNLNLPNN